MRLETTRQACNWLQAQAVGVFVTLRHVPCSSTTAPAMTSACSCCTEGWPACSARKLANASASGNKGNVCTVAMQLCHSVPTCPHTRQSTKEDSCHRDDKQDALALHFLGKGDSFCCDDKHDALTPLFVVHNTTSCQAMSKPESMWYHATSYTAGSNQ